MIFFRSDFSSHRLSGNNAYGKYAQLNLTPDDHLDKLNKFSKVIMGVSLLFWCWAVKNTVKTRGGKDFQFDLGIVSFFLSGSSALYIYKITCKGVKGFKNPGTMGRNLVVGAHIIVTINYALGAYLSLILNPNQIYYNFLYYCVIFTFLWGCSAFVAFDLISNTLSIEPDDDDYDIPDYNF